MLITKDLPEVRADYGFGDLIFFHVIRYGTRPDGIPTNLLGQPWEPEVFAELIGIHPKTLKNWIFETTLPDSIVALSNELFGNNRDWDPARYELHEKFQEAWKRRKDKLAQRAKSAKRPAVEAPEGTLIKADRLYEFGEARTEPEEGGCVPEETTAKTVSRADEGAVRPEQSDASEEAPEELDSEGEAGSDPLQASDAAPESKDTQAPQDNLPVMSDDPPAAPHVADAQGGEAVEHPSSGTIPVVPGAIVELEPTAPSDDAGVVRGEERERQTAHAGPGKEGTDASDANLPDASGDKQSAASDEAGADGRQVERPSSRALTVIAPATTVEPEARKPSEDPRTSRREERKQPITRAVPVLFEAVPVEPEAARKRKQIWIAGLAASIAMLMGTFGWMQINRQTKRPMPQAEKVLAEVQVGPKSTPDFGPKAPEDRTAAQSAAPATPNAQVPPPVISAPPPPSPEIRVEPPAPKPAPPAPPERHADRAFPPNPPAVQPSEDENRLAEEKRRAEQLEKERVEAFDREMKRILDEAIQRDTQPDNGAQRMAALQLEARTVAALGYRLQENRYVPASSFLALPVESLAACAQACTREGCDAFAFDRADLPPGARHARYCYLHRKPYEPGNKAGYVLGELIDGGVRQSDRLGSMNVTPTIRLAQNSPGGAPPPIPEGVTFCSNGPVKVTGFRLTCDQTLGGGTTLGSARLSYSVANINECAAKCRPVSGCTGFTFNAGDPDGRHACIIFGGSPEARESKGWISGIR